MTDRIKEWDEYFGIHCHLPAAAIRDLFDEIERLQKHHAEAQHRIGEYVDLTARLRAALERIANNEDCQYASCGVIAREALQDGE